ncbi:MAG: Do family serine endopeptidase [Holosporales bacterium]|jgi:serine protease Do|nr:Do family serine endopeptidase [Holosporales bacterium]
MRTHLSKIASTTVLCLSLILSRAIQAEDAGSIQVPQTQLGIAQSFSPVVKKSSPAVVNIYTKRKVREVGSVLADPLFGSLFGPFSGVMPVERIQNALGSGVIVRADGLVVTNHHIVENSSEIRLVLHDGREVEAKIVVDDSKTDLALLKIQNAKGPFPYLDLRSIDTLEVGDLVLAIGNPFGLGQSVTLGIISALARTHVGEGRYRYYIQTDAAINRGNSGGALISLDGKLVGVNTFILSASGGSQGLGFAIPADLIRQVISVADQGGKVIRPWLGVKHAPVPQEVADALGMTRAQGTQIVAILKGSPAEKAGLQIGDVVTHIDERIIEDEQALIFRIGTKSVGDTIRLRIHRKGKQIELNVTLTAPADIPPRKLTTLKGPHPLNAVTICNINPAVMAELSAAIVDSEGVVVFSIEKESTIDLAPGDILLKINDKKISSVSNVQEALKTAHPVWQFTIKRGNQKFKFSIRR